MLPNFLPVGPSFALRCSALGNEQQPLVEVTDFLAHADLVKRYAVEQSGFRLYEGYYPGIRMPSPRQYVQALTFHLQESLITYFGIDPSRLRSVTSFYSIVTTPESELQFLQKIPHFDVPFLNGIAVLHYLCDMPENGTSFYRHKQTGFEYIDASRSSQYFETVEDEFLGRKESLQGFIGDSTPEYERIAQRPALFNRLLAYRGSSLHSGNISGSYDFNPDPDAGRLTIASFLQA